MQIKNIIGVGSVYKRTGCSQFMVSNKRDVLKITKLMYKNNNVFIKRKYDRLVSATNLVIDSSKNRI